MTGDNVNVENVGPSKIPPVDAGLFNNLYYLTFNEKDTQNFKENHLDNLHFEGNAKSSKTNIVTFLLFDILHKKDENNCYPLHMMMSNLIHSSKRTDLMDFLSSLETCLCPSSYYKFCNEMASKV